MKLLEKILGILALVGINLALIPMPGGNMLTILGLGLLSIMYFYLGFAFFNGIRARDMFKKSSYKGIKAIRIIGAIGTGFVLSIIITGVLFKIMMWPGASAMLIVGVLPVMVLSLISALKYSADKSGYYKRILLRVMVFGGLGIALFSLPRNTIMKTRYRCCPEYVKAAEAAANDPENAELQQKADEERRKIEGEE